MSSVIRKLMALVLLVFPALSQAIESCFVYAETHYEQVYCEIQEEGEGKGLPSFFDFRKNNEITQALLLKRKAKGLGIVLKMPTTKVDRSPSPKLKAATEPEKSKSSDTKVAIDTPCTLSKTTIQCPGSAYRLIGNQSNRKLDKGVLSDRNTLGMSEYSDDPNDTSKINRYLAKNYALYLEKMLAIGLGGVTMPYAKFHYLYHDLTQKGAGFAARFERMYGFLKRDKRQNAVSESVQALPGITIDDCVQLTDRLFTCDNQSRNSVYVKI